MPKLHYQRIEGSDVSDVSDWSHREENSSLRCSQCKPRNSAPRILSRALPWVLCLASSILLVISRSYPSNCSCVGVMSTALDPDQDIIPAFPRKRVLFHGSPEFYPNRTGYIPALPTDSKWPENINYFAEPTDAIDSAWDKLLGNVTISISSEEAHRAWGHEYLKYRDFTQGGFTAVPDIIHTLHCLDTMRRARYHERYTPAHGPEHLEHCMDYLRQSILCYSSTKLIPTRQMEHLHVPYIDANQPHTCNDFPAIAQWMEDRAPGAKAYEPREKWQ